MFLINENVNPAKDFLEFVKLGGMRGLAEGDSVRIPSDTTPGNYWDRLGSADKRAIKNGEVPDIKSVEQYEKYCDWLYNSELWRGGDGRAPDSDWDDGSKKNRYFRNGRVDVGQDLTRDGVHSVCAAIVANWKEIEDAAKKGLGDVVRVFCDVLKKEGVDRQPAAVKYVALARKQLNKEDVFRLISGIVAMGANRYGVRTKAYDKDPNFEHRGERYVSETNLNKRPKDENSRMFGKELSFTKPGEQEDWQYDRGDDEDMSDEYDGDAQERAAARRLGYSDAEIAREFGPRGHFEKEPRKEDMMKESRKQRSLAESQINYWAHMLDEAMEDKCESAGIDEAEEKVMVHGYDVGRGALSDSTQCRDVLRQQLLDLPEDQFDALWEMLYPHTKDWRFIEALLKDGYDVSRLKGDAKSKFAQVSAALARKGAVPPQVAEFKEYLKRIEDEVARREKEWSGEIPMSDETKARLGRGMKKFAAAMFSNEGPGTREIEGLPEESPMYAGELMADIQALDSACDEWRFMLVETEDQFQEFLASDYLLGTESRSVVGAPRIVKFSGRDAVSVMTNAVSGEDDGGQWGEYQEMFRKLKAFDPKLPVVLNVGGKNVIIRSARLTASSDHGTEVRGLHLIV